MVPDDKSATVPGHGGATPAGDDATVDTGGTDDSFLREVAGTPALDPGPMPGDVIDDSFRIEKKLGAGGMGVVYLATDLRLHREVAIKLHAPGPAMAERTEREAKVMARLTHPNVVTVYEVGAWRDRIYIAMEYCDGGTLRTWLAARRHTWREVLARFLAAARGLAAAHAAGLVHRDFKPDNVLLGSDGRVRVADFGVARTARPRPDEPELPGTSQVGSIAQPLTAAGAVVGTPGYMAPEAERGDEVDARADQFSYCIALRRALAPSKPPRWIGRILARGLEAAPDKRWPSMAALVDQLERTRRGRRLAIGGAVVVGAAAITVTALLMRASPSVADRRCTGSAAALATAWSPDRATAIHRAIARARDPASADRVVAAVDRWGHDWVDMHREACMATTVRGEQSQGLLDQRMLCLERGRAMLAATVALIVTDPRAAVNAPLAIDELPPVAPCGDLDALASLSPVPDDPTRAAAVSELLDEVAHANARIHAGDVPGGLAALDTLLPRVRELGWDPLRAEVVLRVATVRGQLGNEVTALLDEAASAAVAGRDDYVAMSAWIALGIAAVHRLDDGSAGSWLDLARGALRRGHVNGNMIVELEMANAERARYQNHPVDALMAAQRAVARAALRDVNMNELARAQTLLGSIEVIAGDPRDARTVLAAAIATTDDLESVASENAVIAHTWMALAEMQLGDRAQAVADARALLATVRRYRGERNVEVADALSVLGATLIGTRELDGARTALREARRLLLAQDVPDPTRLASVLGNLAIVDGTAGRSRDAYDESVASLDAYAKLYPADSPALVNPQLIVASYAHDVGKLDEAAARAEAAYALATRALPAKHTYRLAAARTLAFMRVESNHFADAIAPAEEAEAGLRDGDPQYLAEVRYTLARALWGADGDRSRAVRLARQAHDGYAALGDAFASERDEIATWLYNHRDGVP